MADRISEVIEKEIQSKAEAAAEKIWRETCGAMWPRLRDVAGHEARWPFHLDKEIAALRDKVVPALAQSIASGYRAKVVENVVASIMDVI